MGEQLPLSPRSFSYLDVVGIVGEECIKGDGGEWYYGGAGTEASLPPSATLPFAPPPVGAPLDPPPGGPLPHSGALPHAGGPSAVGGGGQGVGDTVGSEEADELARLLLAPSIPSIPSGSRRWEAGDVFIEAPRGLY